MFHVETCPPITSSASAKSILFKLCADNAKLNVETCRHALLPIGLHLYFKAQPLLYGGFPQASTLKNLNFFAECMY
jgi:hypothetical protein